LVLTEVEAGYSSVFIIINISCPRTERTQRSCLHE